MLNNNGVKKYHDGLDVGVYKMSVNSPFSGEVVAKIDSNNTYDDRGDFVVIKYSSQNVYVWFYHMESISVEVGDVVEKNQQIGVSGNSGYNNGGSYPYHLHMTFSTTYSGSGVNHLDTFDPLMIYGDMFFSPSSDNRTDGIVDEGELM